MYLDISSNSEYIPSCPFEVEIQRGKINIGSKVFLSDGKTYDVYKIFDYRCYPIPLVGLTLEFGGQPLWFHMNGKQQTYWLKTTDEEYPRIIDIIQ